MVSVLINNHNYGEYIGQAIESVLSQTYKDYEIIIVDGDSTDNSREVIMSYVNKYPQIITAVFKPTSGQAAAFNVGFKLSKGEVIAFLDSDDFFYNNKLERIVELHKQYEVVGHARKMHDFVGNLKEVYAPIDEYDKRPMLFHEYGYIYTYNLITSCISVKRDVLSKILPMPEKEYMTFADCYVKVMAQYYSNVKYVRETLSYYRVHKKQETNLFENSKLLEQFCADLYNRVFNDINKVLEKRGETLIPECNQELLKKALAIANPDLEIIEGEKYVIYGVGAHSYKVEKCVKLLGGEFIYAVDSDSKKWGGLWCGVPIISPEEAVAKRKQYKKIIIGSTYHAEIENTLQSYDLVKKRDYALVVSIPRD